MVVDNGSQDNTKNVAMHYTKHVITEKRIGYGIACLAGIKYINSLPEKPKAVCFFDGDGQSLVTDINKVCFPVLNAVSEYCQGTRMINSNAKETLTGNAYVANKVFSIILSVLWKQKITDLGPLRCVKLDLLNALHMKSTGYSWTMEMNAKLLKSKKVQLEVPVNYHKRTKGKSKISGNFISSLIAASTMTVSLIKILLFYSPIR